MKGASKEGLGGFGAVCCGGAGVPCCLRCGEVITSHIPLGVVLAGFSVFAAAGFRVSDNPKIDMSVDNATVGTVNVPKTRKVWRQFTHSLPLSVSSCSMMTKLLFLCVCLCLSVCLCLCASEGACGGEDGVGVHNSAYVRV